MLYMPALAAALIPVSSKATPCSETLSLASATPYPTSPLRNEVQYSGYNESSKIDLDMRRAIHDGLVDIVPMLSTAVSSLRNLGDDTFDRHFPKFAGENDSALFGRSYVEVIFNMIVDLDADPPGFTPLITEFINEPMDRGGCCAKGAGACFHAKLDRFQVCPLLLRHSIPASAMKCTKFGTMVTGYMTSLTSTLLHECLHSGTLTRTAPVNVGFITDVTYTAANCIRLAAHADSQKAYINADSYTWFAINAYYNDVCGRKFDSEEAASWGGKTTLWRRNRRTEREYVPARTKCLVEDLEMFAW